MDERLGNLSTTPTEVPLSRTAALSLLALCAALLVGLARACDVDLIDDSYIFLVYARHIAHGLGPVFNPGERVEGFSSPLWTFILGGFGTMTENLERVAYVLGTVCGVGVVAYVVRQAARTGAWSRAELVVLGVGVATTPAVFYWSASGMETMLFTLLVVASMGSVLHDRSGRTLSARSALLLLLATLARPEGLFLAAFTALFFLYERRSIRTLIAYGLAVAAMLLARYGYYGEWLPNTYHAKVTFSLMRRIQDGTNYVMTGLTSNVLLVVITGATSVWAWRKNASVRPVLVFLGGWIVAWVGYVAYVGGDNFNLSRFLFPASAAMVLMLIRSWALIGPTLSTVQRRACLATLVTALFLSHGLTYRDQGEGYHGNVRFARAWSDVGRWIERETPDDTVIATVVPGAMAYFAHRTTIDMLGLTDREVCLRGKVSAGSAHGHARYNTDYIFSREPDLVVYHSSGRFSVPVYEDPERIHQWSGFALYDFVTDPRCRERYAYVTASLDNGLLVEMQKKRGTAATSLVSTAP